MTYVSEVLADSPGVYWRFGESSGTTAADASGNGRAGTYVGSPTLGVAGAVSGDTAVDLNGTSQYVEIADAAWQRTASFSVEALIRPDAVDYLKVIAAKDGSSIGWNFLVYNTLRCYANGSLYFGSTNIPVGTWSHVALTYDSATSTLRFYYNGDPDGVGTGVALTQTSVAALLAGVSTGGGGGAGRYFHFDGKLDEWAYYPGVVLSPSRIASHYAALTPATSDATVTATTGTGSAQGQAPGVSGNSGVQAPTGSGSGTGQTPSTSAGAGVSAPTGSAAAQGQAPAARADTAISAPSGTGSAQAPAPGAGSAAVVTPPAGTGSGQAQVPGASAGSSTQAPAGTGSAQGQDPVVSGGGSVTISVPAGSASASASAPEVEGTPPPVPLDGLYVDGVYLPSLVDLASEVVLPALAPVGPVTLSVAAAYEPVVLEPLAALDPVLV